MIRRVELSKLAQKQLRRVPRHIARKLLAWVDDVQACGLEVVRKIPGYHNEPLHGNHRGEWSIRLSRAYRAIYVVKDNGIVEFVSVVEVTKHEY